MSDAEPVRVLLALEPRMYREVIAFSLRKERPDVEIVDGFSEVARLAPHVVVANRGPSPVERPGTFWLAVSLDGKMGAEISADGYSRTMELAIENLLEVVDRADAQALDA